MHKRIHRSILFVVIWCPLPFISLPSLSTAAEVNMVAESHCQLSVTGKIQRGDAEKIEALAKKSNVSAICLNSIGGSWVEGLRIAEYVMDHFIGTYVGEGAKCYSSCAMILLAGARKGRRVQAPITKTNEIFLKDFFRLPNRTMHARARVGFHAPYLTLRQRRYRAGDIQAARVAALQAFAKFVGMMSRERKVESSSSYLPLSFILRAMKMKRNELLMVDTVGKAAQLGVDLVGYKQPKRIAKRNLFWIIVNFRILQNDEYESTKEFLRKMKIEGHPVKYVPPLFFKQVGSTTRAIFNVYLWALASEGEDPNFFIELKKAHSDRMLMYISYHTFGSYYEVGPRGNLIEIASDPDQDKKRLMRMGMIDRIINSGNAYLLTPTWYIYPADTKLVDIAKK